MPHADATALRERLIAALELLEAIGADRRVLDELSYRRDTDGNHWTLVRRCRQDPEQL